MSKKKATPKGVKVYVAPDLAAAFQAQGDDWEARIDAALRAHIAGVGPGVGSTGPSKTRVSQIIADAVAPLKDHPLAPHVEKAARDMTAKVAKDVATAAVTAALAAWSTKMADRPTPPPSPPTPPEPRNPAPGHDA